MDLQDQLKNLFPEHKLTETSYSTDEIKKPQEEPIICKYEKRKGKPITILENFKINNSEIKTIAKDLKKSLSVGGTVKENYIIIQGDYRDKIMKILNSKGFETKRVGG